MKTEQNRYVKSSKWMLLIGLTLLVVILILTPGGRHSNESRVVRAKQNAEVLGLQLTQIYNQEKSRRTPASGHEETDEAFKGEGLIGLDPWGQPYKYNILRTDQGIARVVVTSDGPPRDPQSQSDTNSDDSSEKIRVVVSPAE
jgi:hypothetical protein